MPLTPDAPFTRRAAVLNMVTFILCNLYATLTV